VFRLNLITGAVIRVEIWLGLGLVTVLRLDLVYHSNSTPDGLVRVSASYQIFSLRMLLLSDPSCFRDEQCCAHGQYSVMGAHG